MSDVTLMKYHQFWESNFAQSAGAEENTDCISAEG